MSALQVVNNPTPSRELADLEPLLNELTRYGKVRLSYMGDGWYSIIEMYVSSQGAEFKVASDFRIATPYEATRQCYERMLKTLEDLTK